MTVVEVLTKARALVAKGWTKRHFATDAEDRPVRDTDPRACKFCMSGALWAASGGDDVLRSHARSVLGKAVGQACVVDYNDAGDTTHADVLAAFDRAIKAAKSC